MNIKRKIIIVSTITLILILTLTLSYGFFQGEIGAASLTNISAKSYKSDRLNFNSGTALSLSADVENFGENDGNLTSSTSGTAVLIPRTDTNTASYTYNAYLVITNNDFEYGSNNTPELLLSVTKNDGTNTTTIINNQDITTTDGYISLGVNIPISVTNNANGVTHTWNVTLTFVNLNENQEHNEGKTFSAKLVLQQEKKSLIELLNSKIITVPSDYSVAPTDQTSGLFSAQDDYGTSYVFRGNINYNWAKFGKESVSTNCTNSGGTKDVMSATGEKITMQAACETTYTYSCSNENTIFVGTTSTLDACATLGLTITSSNITGTYHATAVTIEKDMYWRVVRINGNGNLRMIYSGNFAPKANQIVMAGEWTRIGTTAFNTTSNNNAYVGYMYGDTSGTTLDAVHANTNTSTIKAYIDNWYTNNTNLGTTNDNIVADDYFCYDRTLYSGTVYGTDYTSGTGIGSVATAYGAAGRIISSSSTWSIKTGASPTLICPQAKDMYIKTSTTLNNKTTVATGAKVGLLSADEAVLAGTTTSSNSTYYLYTGKWYWLGSPRVFNADGVASVFFVNSIGFLGYTLVSNATGGARPVISVSYNYIASGDGTASSPWIISN